MRAKGEPVDDGETLDGQDGIELNKGVEASCERCWPGVLPAPA
jgi:hypothetical protein